MKIVNYSEKSIALFGDTKAIKEHLKGLNGRFNPFLKQDNQTLAGWIFSKNKESDLIKLLESLDLLNSDSKQAEISEQTSEQISEIKEIVKPDQPVKVEPVKVETKKAVKNTNIKFNWQSYFKLKVNKLVPVFECLYFDVENQRVIHTNLENFVIVPFWEDLKVNQSCCINFNNLKAVKDLQSIEVIESVALVNEFIKLTVESPEDFPKLPTFKIDEEIKIIDFNVVKKGLYSLSKDEYRPAMNGVYFHQNKIVTTNGHTLYIANLNQNKELEKGYILNAEACKLITKDCSILFGLTNSIIKFEDYEIITKNIDERFPDYENCIPLDNPIKFDFNKFDLISTITKVLPFANKQIARIKFEVKENVCTLSAEDLDLKKEISLSINCKANEAIIFGMNGKTLIDVLKNIESNTVDFYASAPHRPFLIREEKATHLIMPIILNN